MIWLVVGFVVAVLIGIGFLVVGFMLGSRDGQQPDQVAQATATMTLEPLPSPLAVVPTTVSLPTATLPPAATAAPTAVPEPMIVAQEGGVNLRSGPGTNFPSVGRLEGGASSRVTGKYADWWQVDYGGVSAWVAGWVVSASNVEAVADVVPPPSPIPPTPIPPTATPIPATAVPPTPAGPDLRGLRVDYFAVGLKVDGQQEVNPQASYGNAGDIWFCFDVVNSSGGTVTLTKAGGYVQETGDFQISWGASGPFDVPNGGSIGGTRWCDHFYNDKVNMGAGTYNIWLRICFGDGYCANASGPISVKIG